MTAIAKVTVFEITKGRGYELVTAAGDDRPAYVGTREWREQQQAAIPNDSRSRLTFW